MATHSSILAWRSPWTEEPGELQSIGSHRVGEGRLHTFPTWADTPGQIHHPLARSHVYLTPNCLDLWGESPFPALQPTVLQGHSLKGTFLGFEFGHLSFQLVYLSVLSPDPTHSGTFRIPAADVSGWLNFRHVGSLPRGNERTQLHGQ